MLSQNQRGTERIATPVETSTATRYQDLDDHLVATLNHIPFVRARALNEAGSLKLKPWESTKEAQGFRLG